jgi:hypothetical protein
VPALNIQNHVMSRNQPIPWTRIDAEGTAIVVSILFAFAIDAWWEGRRETAIAHEQM